MSQNVSDVAAVYDNLELQSVDRQIRLLKISNQLVNGFISCQLTRHDLTSTKYVVLSYQWGLTSASHPILLNNQHFLVRTNLHSFLNVFRQQPDVYLWVDALCINQADNDERNRQVRIMGSIFRSAAMVLSWLGPHNDSVCTAFELMSSVYKPADETDVSETLPVSDVSEDHLWQCVVEVCRLPYWSRVWVVQEILLSGNNYLMCGEKTLTWQFFANFMSLIGVRFRCAPQFDRVIQASTAMSYTVSKPYVTVPAEMQWRVGSDMIHDYGKEWNKQEYNLFRILTMFGDRACSDQLDHIYALLSLTDEGKRFPVRYDDDAVELLLEVFHFCGAAAQTNAEAVRRYESLTQRALLRNLRFLAEILEIIPMPEHHHPTPYFAGLSSDGRSPNPRSDPCFAREDQEMVLMCTAVIPGNEPPVLKSSTLRRNLSAVTFDSILHIDESTSWLLCRTVQHENGAEFDLMAVVTIKEGVNGRGFRILEPRYLRSASISMDSALASQWTLRIPVEAHLDLIKIVILGM